MERAIETAEISTGRKRTFFETNDLLAERSFGIWAGKPWDEIKKRTQELERQNLPVSTDQIETPRGTR